MARRRPLIAISGPSLGARMPRLLVGAVVRMYGARAVQLSPARGRVRRAYQGVVITGGSDVQPALYGESVSGATNADPVRDAFEAKLIDDALRCGLPLLGICRGAQLLNVCLGGSLYQDLTPLRRRTPRRRMLLPRKITLVDSDSRLWRHTRRTRLCVNSLHRQGIKRLGAGLEVTARDLDGIVQGVEGPGRYLIGVQWHPEYLLHSQPQRRLFAALVNAARATC